MESIPEKEGAHFKVQNLGRRSKTIRASIHIACRPNFSLAGMPDNGPNAGACGGDIMRVNWLFHFILNFPVFFCLLNHVVHSGFGLREVVDCKKVKLHIACEGLHSHWVLTRVEGLRRSV